MLNKNLQQEVDNTSIKLQEKNEEIKFLNKELNRVKRLRENDEKIYTKQIKKLMKEPKNVTNNFNILNVVTSTGVTL